MPFFTVAASPGARLCKHVTADGPQPVGPLPYDTWTFRGRRVDSTEELHDLLSELRNRRDAIIVRGVVRPDVEQPCRKHGETLQDLPQPWVMLDFDSAPEPEGLEGFFPSDPEGFAALLVEQLPEQFRTASYVWRASGSAGFKPGIRLHLWFLLEIPVTRVQLETWLADCPIDRTVFRTVQPHFTSDPLLDDGIADPMAARIGRVTGATDLVSVPAFAIPESTAIVRADTSTDPLTAIALAAWNTEHAALLADYVPGSTRYECPACGSSDGLAVREDGRFNCHGAKHAELDPPVGTQTSTGVFVGTACEFFEQLPTGTMREWLRAKYPPAISFSRPASATVQPEELVSADTIDIGDIGKAQKRLENARKILKGNKGQLHVLARDLGRYVPKYLSRQQIEDMAIGSCTSGPGAITRPAAETILATAIDEGMADPWAPRAAGGLSRNELGLLNRCQANVTEACQSTDIAPLLAFDEFSGREIVTAVPPWWSDDSREYPRRITDADYTRIVSYLSDVHNYAHASTGQVATACSSVALDNRFNPVQDYLRACKWDGTREEAIEFLESFFPTFAHVADSPYSRAVGKRWLLAAVQRVFEPGCTNREVLTLLGAQYTGKSSIFGALCPDRSWFLEGMQITGSKDNKSMLRGKWIVCVDEIDRDLKADGRTGAVKNFISTRYDTFRPAYGHNDIDAPRTCVLGATTNAKELFVDTTGNTRINVLESHATIHNRIDLDGVVAVRDLLWGAAVLCYEAGETTYLQPVELDLAAAVAAKHMDVSDTERCALELWEGGVPALRVDQSQVSALGFEWKADQVAADRSWVYLTSDQIQLRFKMLGQRYNGKRVAFALRNHGLTYGRLVRVAAQRSYGYAMDVTILNTALHV